MSTSPGGGSSRPPGDVLLRAQRPAADTAAGRFSILAPALLPGPSRPAAILRAWAPGAAGGLRDALLAGASSLARSPLG